MENLRSKIWTVYAGTDASSVEIEATDLVQPIDRVE